MQAGKNANGTPDPKFDFRRMLRSVRIEYGNAISYLKEDPHEKADDRCRLSV
jgi:hypothetical protein